MYYSIPISNGNNGPYTDDNINIRTLGDITDNNIHIRTLRRNMRNDYLILQNSTLVRSLNQVFDDFQNKKKGDLIIFIQKHIQKVKHKQCMDELIEWSYRPGSGTRFQEALNDFKLKTKMY